MPHREGRGRKRLPLQISVPRLEGFPRATQGQFDVPDAINSVLSALETGINVSRRNAAVRQEELNVAAAKQVQVSLAKDSALQSKAFLEEFPHLTGASEHVIALIDSTHGGTDAEDAITDYIRRRNNGEFATIASSSEHFQSLKAAHAQANPGAPDRTIRFAQEIDAIDQRFVGEAAGQQFANKIQEGRTAFGAYIESSLRTYSAGGFNSQEFKEKYTEERDNYDLLTPKDQIADQRGLVDAAEAHFLNTDYIDGGDEFFQFLQDDKELVTDPGQRQRLTGIQNRILAAKETLAGQARRQRTRAQTTAIHDFELKLARHNNETGGAPITAEIHEEAATIIGGTAAVSRFMGFAAKNVLVPSAGREVSDSIFRDVQLDGSPDAIDRAKMTLIDNQRSLSKGEFATLAEMIGDVSRQSAILTTPEANLWRRDFEQSLPFAKQDNPRDFARAKGAFNSAIVAGETPEKASAIARKTYDELNAPPTPALLRGEEIPEVDTLPGIQRELDEVNQGLETTQRFLEQATQGLLAGRLRDFEIDPSAGGLSGLFGGVRTEAETRGLDPVETRSFDSADTAILFKSRSDIAEAQIAGRQRVAWLTRRQRRKQLEAELSRTRSPDQRELDSVYGSSIVFDIEDRRAVPGRP